LERGNAFGLISREGSLNTRYPTADYRETTYNLSALTASAVPLDVCFFHAGGPIVTGGVLFFFASSLARFCDGEHLAFCPLGLPPPPRLLAADRAIGLRKFCGEFLGTALRLERIIVLSYAWRCEMRMIEARATRGRERWTPSFT